MNETPVDLAAVQADDALLDALTAALYGDDAVLARVLVAWRREVDAEPVGELVDTDTALSVIAAAKPKTFVDRVVDVFLRLSRGQR